MAPPWERYYGPLLPKVIITSKKVWMEMERGSKGIEIRAAKNKKESKKTLTSNINDFIGERQNISISAVFSRTNVTMVLELSVLYTYVYTYKCPMDFLIFHDILKTSLEILHLTLQKKFSLIYSQF